MFGGRYQWRMHYNDVAVAHQAVQIHRLDARLRCTRKWVISQHPAAERRQLAGGEAADAPEPYDATGQVGQSLEFRARWVPASGPNLAIEVIQTTGPGQDESKRMVGNLLHAIVWHVRYPDSTVGRGLHSN